MPRTAQRIVNELHTLLTNARMEGPYVLVGHSFGGLTARLYAAQYPEEVVGMVLVDPTHPSQWLQMTEEQRKRLETGARLSRRGGILARLGIARLTAFLVSAGALGIARFSVSLVSGGALNQRAERILAPVKKLPSELWPILRALWVQPKFFEALASEMERSGGLEEDCEGLVNYALGIQGVEVALFFRELADGRYRVSLRSKGQVNVAAVAEQFGGGGHICASGCAVSGPLSTSLELILTQLRSVCPQKGDGPEATA